MTRTARSPSLGGEWFVVSEKNPCPICGASTGPCSSNEDELFVTCAHCPSDWLLTTGAWLHRIPTEPTLGLADEESFESASGTAA